MHQKVHDARVNAVDPLAHGSARKQYSKNKDMLIFNLVSILICINTRQTKLSPGSWRNNETVRRIVACFIYLRHSNTVLI